MEKELLLIDEIVQNSPSSVEETSRCFRSQSVANPRSFNLILG